MNINNFVDPIEEIEATADQLDERNIIKHIAAQFGPERDAESDEEDVERPKIKIFKALAALE